VPNRILAIVMFLTWDICAHGQQTCSTPTPVFNPPVVPAGETQPLELNGLQTLPQGFGPNETQLQNFAMVSSIYGASGLPWIDCKALVYTRITGAGTFLAINSANGDFLIDETGLGAGQVPTVVNQWSKNAANLQPPITGQQPLMDWDHEAIRLPNGSTAVIGHEEMMVTSTTQCPTAQFPTNYCDVMGDKIVVMNLAGTVEWVWDSFNAAQFPYLSRRAILGDTCTASAAGGTCPITLATVAQDWLHANSLWYDPADGNLVISLRNQDWIVKVAYQNGAGDGSVVWRLGNEGDFTTEVTNQQFPWEDYQHDVTSPSPGVYSMFDNGNGRHASNGANSRGLVYTINEAARVVTAMQAYTLGVYSPGSGAAQLLANGNWAFMAGRPQNPSGIYSEQFEFAPNGSAPLWTEILPQQYRETRLSGLFYLTNNALGGNSVVVGSAAGSGTAQLVSSAPWTATSNAPWLQIAPGSASGAGSALIQFSYSANPNAAAQTGTLTIGGLTFTVTQAGTSYVPVSPVTPLVSSGLDNPQGLAVDSQANLYIADTDNNNIQEWSPGTLQTAILSGAQIDPAAVAVDQYGNVYIADAGNHAIEEYSPANRQLNTLVSGLSNPSGVAVDGQGNVYFSDTRNNVIDEWNAATQQVVGLAGSGLNNPTGVAVDAQGNVYFADSGNNSVKEWEAASRQVSVLVPSGLNDPTGVVVDGLGNVYIADTGNNAIKQWNPGTQQVTSLALNALNNPMGVAVDGQGNIYVADTNNNAIRELTPAYLALSSSSLNEGSAAGTDSVTAQVLPATVPLTATNDQPWLTITGIDAGTINFTFAANSSTLTQTAHITVLGMQVTVTQNGLTGQTIAFGPLPDLVFGSAPFMVNATASSGLPVSFASTTPSVCTVTGNTVTLAGIGLCSIQAAQPGNSLYPAATPVTQSFHVAQEIFGGASLTIGSAAGSNSVEIGFLPLIATPSWSASVSASWLHPASTNGSGPAIVPFSFDANPNPTVRSGAITLDSGVSLTVTQAGSSYLGPGPVLPLAPVGLSGPTAVAVDSIGNVYIADTGHNAIAEWNAATQQLTSLVSSGLSAPAGVAVDGAGNVYIADTGHNALKEWNVFTQQVATLVSTGLSRPLGLAVDTSGNVYIADSLNNAIEEWNAATQQMNPLVPGGLNNPSGVAVDAAGNVYIADTGDSAIRELVAATQQLTSLVPAGVNQPAGVAVDGSGNVYVADTGGSAIEEWSASTRQFTTLVPSGLSGPEGVAVDGAGNVYIADTGNNAAEEMPFVFVGPASLSEPLAAGSDTLLAVVPASTSLVGIFAPSSNQSWLTIGAIANGIVNFSFTANTSSARTAQISLLGQQISVTQAGLTAQTIAFGPLANQAYGAAPFTVNATASSGLTVSFASITPAACTLSGTTVTLAAVGTCTVQATQAGNGIFAAAPAVNQTFQVTQGTQTIAFGPLPNVPFGTPAFPVIATASSGLPVTLVSSTPTVCTLSGATASLLNAGTCTIKSGQAGNADWAPAPPVTQSFLVTQESQTVTFGPLLNQPFGTPPFTVSATATSGLAVSFTSYTPPVCTVSGTTVTLVVTGLCTVQARQGGNANWATAVPVNQSFLVTQESQTVVFGALPNLPFGSAPFTVSATATSGLTVSFTSTTPPVCTVSGTTVTLVATGLCTVQARQGGSTIWATAVPVNQSFHVFPGSQTITFPPLSNQALGSPPFTVGATASSGLAVGFASTTPAVCTMSGATVSLLTAGTCTIKAGQGGNTNWSAAAPVTQSFQVTM